MMKPFKTQIFVSGCQRSGTTLLGAILGSAKGCLVTPECQFKRFLLRDLKWDAGREENLRLAYQFLSRNLRFKIWGVDLTEKEILENSQVESYQSLLTYIIRKYEVQNFGQESPATVWVDHDPQSLAEAELLKGSFPDAKYVHIVRDPRAVAASVLPLQWGPPTVLEAGAYWRGRVEKALEAESQLAASSIYRVHFEDLVQRPHETVRKLCDWFGISFHESMLNGGRFHVPEYTREQHALVGAPVDQSASERWEAAFRPWELKLIESGCQELMQSLGYQPEYMGATIPFYERIFLKLKSKKRRKQQKKSKRERKRGIMDSA